MNWKIDFVEDGITIPESNYGKSAGGIDMNNVIYSIKKEELIKLDWWSLKGLADVLDEALKEVKKEMVIAQAELNLQGVDE